MVGSSFDGPTIVSPATARQLFQQTRDSTPNRVTRYRGSKYAIGTAPKRFQESAPALTCPDLYTTLL